MTCNPPVGCGGRWREPRSLIGGGKGCATGVGRIGSIHLGSNWMWKSRKKTSVEGGLGDSIPKSLPKEGARGQVWDIWSSDRSQGWPELVVYV